MESEELAFTQMRQLCAFTKPLDYQELAMMIIADEKSRRDNGPAPCPTLYGPFLVESLEGKDGHCLCFHIRKPGAGGEVP